MTAQEAIERIREHNTIHKYKEHHAIYITEAFEMAIDALEKQIPKKPVMGYAFGEKIREVIKRTDPERAKSKTECCPVCGRTLGVSQFVKTQTGLHVGDPHCKRCGQAIDWSEDKT